MSEHTNRQTADEKLVLSKGEHLWADGGRSDNFCVLCGCDIQDYPQICPAAPDLVLEAGQHLMGEHDQCLICGCDIQESHALPCDHSALL